MERDQASSSSSNGLLLTWQNNLAVDQIPAQPGFLPSYNTSSTKSTNTDLLMMSSPSVVPGSSSKRSRVVYPRNTQNNPCCQVEGCNVDLKSAKEYHGRHRICEFHSKSPKVVVRGFERRFCQQCSKLHDLSEFDEMKRSCRRRLSDHNARRRRVRPESSIQLTSPGLTSSLYDQRPQDVLLNGSSLGALPLPFPNSRNAEIFQETPRFHNNSISNLHMDSPHNSNQCLSAQSPIARDILSAHSLLSSSNSWSSNIEVGKLCTTPMEEQIVHENLSVFHSNYSTINPAEQSCSPAVPMVNSVNNFHHQEFRLFKAPCDFDSTFYPTTQRNL